MPQAITFSTTSRPTKQQVERQIDFIAAEIDAKLQSLYELPITDSNSIKILSHINALGTAAAIDMPIATASGETDRSSSKILRDIFEVKMKKLLTLKLLLPGETLLTNISPVSILQANDETAFTKENIDDFISVAKI